MSQRDLATVRARLRAASRELRRMVRRGHGDTLEALELQWFINDAESILEEFA